MSRAVATWRWLAAAGRPWLAWPYVGYLAATTLAVARLARPAGARSALRLVRRETGTAAPAKLFGRQLFATFAFAAALAWVPRPPGR